MKNKMYLTPEKVTIADYCGILQFVHLCSLVVRRQSSNLWPHLKGPKGFSLVIG